MTTTEPVFLVILNQAERDELVKALAIARTIVTNYPSADPNRLTRIQGLQRSVNKARKVAATNV